MPEDFGSLSRRGTYSDEYLEAVRHWDDSSERPARSNQNYVYASWGRRAGGAVIDYLAPWFVFFWMTAADHVTGGTIAFLLWVGVNSVVIESQSGWTIGRIVFGTQLVYLTKVGQQQEEYAQLPTFGRVVWRLVAHLVDTGLLLWGWFRPLTDAHHRTYADSLASTIVVRSGTVELQGQRYLTEEPQQPRRSYWQ